MDWSRRGEGFELQKTGTGSSPKENQNSAKRKRCSDATSSWKRCAEGFDGDSLTDTQPTTPYKTDVKKQRTSSTEKKQLYSTPEVNERQVILSEETLGADIDWSDSDNDSDSMDDVIPPSPPSQTRSQISKMILTSNLKCSPLSYQESDSDISTYGSPSQDVKDRLLSQPQEDMSPNISMPSSHQSSVSSGKGNTNGCCDSSPKKGSDWLKSVQWQTPDKKPQVTSLVQPDSTRKSKKFVRGGLAERLQQILLREKSSMAFWSHHNAMNSTGSNGGSSLTVRLLSLEVQCQMRITKCEVISNTDSQGNTSPTTIFVLFTPTISDQLCLVNGSLVKIYPPWQKLTLPHHKDPILLCTYYCRSVDSDCTEDSDTSSQLMASLQPTECDQQLSLSVISPKKKKVPTATLR